MNFSTHHVHKLNGNLIDCQLRISTASFPLPYSGKALGKQDFASSQFLSFQQRSQRIHSFYCYISVTDVSRNKRIERWQKNKTTEGSVVKTFPRGSLLSKCHTFSQFACKCDCIYAYKKYTDVPAPIYINPLRPELNPICYLLALLRAHHFLNVSRIRVKLLTLR